MIMLLWLHISLLLCLQCQILYPAWDLDVVWKQKKPLSSHHREREGNLASPLKKKRSLYICTLNVIFLTTGWGPGLLLYKVEDYNSVIVKFLPLAKTKRGWRPLFSNWGVRILTSSARMSLYMLTNRIYENRTINGKSAQAEVLWTRLLAHSSFPLSPGVVTRGIL